MTINLLDLYCLDAVCDDYENVDMIRSDVRKAAHANVSPAEMQDCLRALVQNAMIEAFEFDPRQSKYIRTDALSHDLSQRWFFITEKGRKERDQNWVDD